MRSLHLFVALGVLVLSGLVHGMWTHRWDSTAAQDGKNLLSGIDGEVGDWKPGEFLAINPAELPEKTRCESRKFMPAKTGKHIVVSVTSGSPGAVAVHTPEVCYLGAGWKLRGAVSRQTIPISDGRSAAFWMADFTKGNESIRIRWGWSADGSWQAPDYPRWTFARSPLLYKLYIVQPLNEDEDLSRDDPYRRFVAELVPALSRQLTP